MSARLITLVDKPDKPIETRQFRGFPPELTDGVDHREQLPWPRVLLIEGKSDGIFLNRFTQDGTAAGDTWHMSIEDAQDQARSEYGIESTEWKYLPETVDDPVAYALNEL